MSTLAAKLKDQGVSAKDIASKAGLSASYVSMLLSGQRANPSAVTIGKIVAASEGALTANDFIDGAQ